MYSMVYGDSKETRCNLIRSCNQQVYSEKVKKLALSPFDDKRYVLPYGYKTLAHRHYRIQREKE